MTEKNKNVFWSSLKKYFLSELRKFWGYSFRVKNSNLLIYDVFRVFGARQIWFLIFEKKYLIFCTIWHKSYQIASNLKNPLYSFEVKLSDLSIYDVFRAFGVRKMWFLAPTRYCDSIFLNSKKNKLFFGVENFLGV